MKKSLVLSIVLLLGAQACGPGTRTVYDVRLQNVDLDNSATQAGISGNKYSDEHIEVMWIVKDSRQMSFELTNKSNSTITLPWDEVAFVDQSGQNHRVIHRGVKLIRTDQSLPPSTIVKGGRLSDIIVPADNISYKSGKYGGWRTDAMFGTNYDFKDDLLPDLVKVHLPLQIGKERKEYLFDIRVHKTYVTPTVAKKNQTNAKPTQPVNAPGVSAKKSLDGVCYTAGYPEYHVIEKFKGYKSLGACLKSGGKTANKS